MVHEPTGCRVVYEAPIQQAAWELKQKLLFELQDKVTEYYDEHKP